MSAGSERDGERMRGEGGESAGGANEREREGDGGRERERCSTSEGSSRDCAGSILRRSSRMAFLQSKICCDDLSNSCIPTRVRAQGLGSA
eukprot:1078917-Rhodomonas_salina.1